MLTGIKAEKRRTLLKTLEGPINSMLAPLDIAIVRKTKTHDYSDTRNFIPLDQMLRAARQAGMSVGDYIDATFHVPGATQSVIDQMAEFGVFARPIEVVVEIGPGSGRYLEKTLALCSPSRIEIYETAKEWAAYLAEKYKVVVQPTDSFSMMPTADNSVDLVQAHRVFSTIPFAQTIRYWPEMIRVARPGAHIVFDIMSEQCLNVPILEKWIASETNNGSYPAVMPRNVVIEYFESREVSVVGSFLVPAEVGQVEVFIFKKDSGEGESNPR